jgi:hypothetical protein
LVNPEVFLEKAKSCHNLQEKKYQLTIKSFKFFEAKKWYCHLLDSNLPFIIGSSGASKFLFLDVFHL